jgi:hypothetical protein
MTAPSQSPVRYPSGVSTDQAWGPMAFFGQPNPFMYHVVYDDLDALTTAADMFSQITATGTSASVANAVGIDGGAWLLTTGTAANNASTIASNQAGFILPPQLYTGTGLTSQVYPSKKVMFLARVNVTNVAACGVIVGLLNHQTTPTVAGITDGIYLQITSATVANLIAISGSTVTWTVPIPAAVLSGYYANTNWIDIGFEMDRQQNVYAFFGYPLVGWLPQQAWTGVNNVNASPTPKARVAAFQSVYNGTIVNAWTPTAVALAPTIMAYSIGAASTTMYVDFGFAAKER